MTTLHRAVLAVWLGASAVIPIGIDANALPAGDAGPVQRAEARPNHEGRYRVAQDDDDDDGGGGGGYGGGGGGRDDDDDDDRPSRPSRPSYPSGPIFRPGGPTIRIPNIIIRPPVHDRRQSRPAPPVHDRRASRPTPPPKVHDRRQSKPTPPPKVHDTRASRPAPPPVHDTRASRPAPPPIPIPPPPTPTAADPVCAPAGCTDNFPQLRVGATTLYPYRTNIPADRNRCTGMTAQGCYLRIMNSAPACGGQPTCVMQCPPTVPVLVPQCTAPEEQQRITQQPETPPVDTVKQPDTVEPDKKLAQTTPVDTVKQPDTIEPEKKLAETTPVDTVKQPDTVEPEKKLAETTPVDTVKQPDTVEPEKKLAETTPVDTVKQPDTVEPEKKQAETTPVDTVKQPDTVEPEKKRAETTPVDTVKQPDTVEPEKKRAETTPVDTVKQPDTVEPEKKRAETTPVDTVKQPDTGRGSAQIPLVEPWPKDKPRTEPPADFGFDAAGPSGPVCTPQGGPPPARLSLPTALTTRTILGTAAGVIPGIGGALKGIVQSLLKDDTNDQVFRQAVDYVKVLVPELLAQDFEKALDRKITGIKTVLGRYNDETDLSDRTSDLDWLRNQLDFLEEDFIGDDYPPDRTIAHFVAYGTLKLAILKERADRATDAQRPARQRELDRTIEKYRAHAAKLKEKLAAQRIANLKVEPKCTGHRIGRHSWTTCHYAATDPACGWSGHDFDSEADAKADLARRSEDVRGAYAVALNSLLEPMTQLATALKWAESAAGAPKP